MANRLQFKRGNGNPGAILRAGEPAFDKQNGLLYIGKEEGPLDSNTGELIGGRSYVERVDSIIVSNDDINVGGVATINNLNVTGIATFQNIQLSGDVTGIDILSVNGLNAVGVVTANAGDFETIDVAQTSNLVGDVTFGSAIAFNDGSGVSITGFSTDGELGGPGGSSNALIPTQKAVREAIDSVVLGEVGSLTLEISGDTGEGQVGLGSTSSDLLVIRGGDNIQTIGSGTSITVSLTDDVNVAGELNVTGGVDITGGIQVGGAVTFSGDINVGAGASLTVEDLVVTGETELQGDLEVGGDLNVVGVSTLGGDVVVNGNLTVTGTATTVSFEVRDVQVADRIIELGRIDGDVPAVDTTWETGIALNYRTGGTAKKAGILWQDNAGFNLVSDFTEDPLSGTDQFDPQVTNSSLAKAGVEELFIGDVTTATNRVITTDKDASFNKLYVGAPGDFTGDDTLTDTNKAFAEKEADGLVHIYNANFDGGTYGT